LGDGAGSFAAAVSEAGGAVNAGIAIADFSRDGVVDVAITILDSNQVGLMAGSIAGTLGVIATYAVGTAPTGIASGDLDHDGNPDVVVTNSADNNISVRLGDGAGGLGAETTFAVGTTPVGVALGDFDRDGNLDVVVANSGATTVSVRTGDGAGSFGAEVTYAVGSTPVGVAVGDFNKDGDLDLAVTNNASDTLSVLLGAAGATFGAATNTATSDYPLYPLVGDFDRNGEVDTAVIEGDTAPTLVSGTDPGEVATFTLTGVPLACSSAQDSVGGDVDNDGDVDLVVACAGDGTVKVYDNNGSGGFALSESLNVGSGAGSFPAGVELADLNQDGWLDIAMALRSDGEIHTWTNDGDGTFTFRDSESAHVGAGGGNPWDVEVGDIDKDGDIDIMAVGNEFDNDTNFEVFDNDGTGMIASTDSISHTGDNGRRMTIGDVDNDGDLDVVVGIRDEGDTLIALNDGAGGFPAAFTSVLDDAVGNDVLQPRLADINRDGVLDIIQGNAAGAGLLDRELQLMFGVGDGTFGAVTNFDLNAGGMVGHDAITGDFDSDGDLDVAVPLQGLNAVNFLSGDGAGAFAAIESEATCDDPRYGFAADLDRNGSIDIGIACQADNAANIYLSD